MRSRGFWICAATLLLVGTALTGPVSAGECERPCTKKVIIEVDADEATGGEIERKTVIIHSDGEHELTGEDFAWVGSHHHGEHGPHIVKIGSHGTGGFLGVQLTELTAELREHFGVPGDAGVLVSKVVENSPAEKAGIRVGDIITRVEDAEVDSFPTLKAQVADREDGETVALEVWRDGQRTELQASIETREPKAHHGRRHVILESGDEGACDHCAFHDLCKDDGPCKIKIRCDDGECTCNVNGDDVDCPEDLHHHRMHD
jgi:hypothetical protein